MKKIEFNNHKFEIVKKIPGEYEIWNIGNIGSNEYVPLCERLYPQSKKDFSINAESLKIIKLSAKEALLLRKAASEGIKNKIAAEKALKSKRKDPASEIKKAYAEKTIKIFHRITKD